MRENSNSTYAYITLTESEKPHVHDHNEVPLKAGQLIMIPKKTIHHVSFPKGIVAKAFLIITPKIGKGFKRYINKFSI